MSRAVYIRGTLVERFWAKVDRRGPDDCWLWLAGSSRSGRREVNYGNIKEGVKGSRTWRANRLALLLKTAPADVLSDVDGILVGWLRREDAYYAHLDASHSCDVALCCNPAHLDWKPHRENIQEQWSRKRARAATAYEEEAAYA